MSQGNRWLFGILILSFLLGIATNITLTFVNFRDIESHKINLGESMYQAGALVRRFRRIFQVLHYFMKLVLVSPFGKGGLRGVVPTFARGLMD